MSKIKESINYSINNLDNGTDAQEESVVDHYIGSLDFLNRTPGYSVTENYWDSLIDDFQQNIVLDILEIIPGFEIKKIDKAETSLFITLGFDRNDFDTINDLTFFYDNVVYTLTDITICCLYHKKTSGTFTFKLQANIVDIKSHETKVIDIYYDSRENKYIKQNVNNLQVEYEFKHCINNLYVCDILYDILQLFNIPQHNADFDENFWYNEKESKYVLVTSDSNVLSFVMDQNSPKYLLSVTGYHKLYEQIQEDIFPQIEKLLGVSVEDARTDFFTGYYAVDFKNENDELYSASRGKFYIESKKDEFVVSFGFKIKLTEHYRVMIDCVYQNYKWISLKNWKSYIMNKDIANLFNDFYKIFGIDAHAERYIDDTVTESINYSIGNLEGNTEQNLDPGYKLNIIRNAIDEIFPVATFTEESNKYVFEFSDDGIPFVTASDNREHRLICISVSKYIEEPDIEFFFDNYGSSENYEYVQNCFFGCSYIVANNILDADFCYMLEDLFSAINPGTKYTAGYFYIPYADEQLRIAKSSLKKRYGSEIVIDDSRDELSVDFINKNKETYLWKFANEIDVVIDCVKFWRFSKVKSQNLETYIRFRDEKKGEEFYLVFNKNGYVQRGTYNINFHTWEIVVDKKLKAKIHEIMSVAFPWNVYLNPNDSQKSIIESINYSIANIDDEIVSSNRFAEIADLVETIWPGGKKEVYDNQIVFTYKDPGTRPVFHDEGYMFNYVEKIAINFNDNVVRFYINQPHLPDEYYIEQDKLKFNRRLKNYNIFEEEFCSQLDEFFTSINPETEYTFDYFYFMNNKDEIKIAKKCLKDNFKCKFIKKDNREDIECVFKEPIEVNSEIELDKIIFSHIDTSFKIIYEFEYKSKISDELIKVQCYNGSLSIIESSILKETVSLEQFTIKMMHIICPWDRRWQKQYKEIVSDLNESINYSVSGLEEPENTNETGELTLYGENIMELVSDYFIGEWIPRDYNSILTKDFEIFKFDKSKNKFKCGWSKPKKAYLVDLSIDLKHNEDIVLQIMVNDKFVKLFRFDRYKHFGNEPSDIRHYIRDIDLCFVLAEFFNAVINSNKFNAEYFFTEGLEFDEKLAVKNLKDFFGEDAIFTPPVPPNFQHIIKLKEPIIGKFKNDNVTIEAVTVFGSKQTERFTLNFRYTYGSEKKTRILVLDNEFHIYDAIDQSVNNKNISDFSENILKFIADLAGLTFTWLPEYPKMIFSDGNAIKESVNYSVANLNDEVVRNNEISEYVKSCLEETEEYFNVKKTTIMSGEILKSVMCEIDEPAFKGIFGDEWFLKYIGLSDTMLSIIFTNKENSHHAKFYYSITDDYFWNNESLQHVVTDRETAEILAHYIYLINPDTRITPEYFYTPGLEDDYKTAMKNIEDFFKGEITYQNNDRMWGGDGNYMFYVSLEKNTEKYMFTFDTLNQKEFEGTLKTVIIRKYMKEFLLSLELEFTNNKTKESVELKFDSRKNIYINDTLVDIENIEVMIPIDMKVFLTRVLKLVFPWIKEYNFASTLEESIDYSVLGLENSADDLTEDNIFSNGSSMFYLVKEMIEDNFEVKAGPVVVFMNNATNKPIPYIWFDINENIPVRLKGYSRNYKVNIITYIEYNKHRLLSISLGYNQLSLIYDFDEDDWFLGRLYANNFEKLKEVKGKIRDSQGARIMATMIEILNPDTKCTYDYLKDPSVTESVNYSVAGLEDNINQVESFYDNLFEEVTDMVEDLVVVRDIPYRCYNVSKWNGTEYVSYWMRYILAEESNMFIEFKNKKYRSEMWWVSSFEFNITNGVKAFLIWMRGNPLSISYYVDEDLWVFEERANGLSDRIFKFGKRVFTPELCDIMVSIAKFFNLDSKYSFSSLYCGEPLEEITENTEPKLIRDLK